MGKAIQIRRTTLTRIPTFTDPNLSFKLTTTRLNSPFNDFEIKLESGSASITISLGKEYVQVGTTSYIRLSPQLALNTTYQVGLVHSGSQLTLTIDGKTIGSSAFNPSGPITLSFKAVYGDLQGIIDNIEGGFTEDFSNLSIATYNSAGTFMIGTDWRAVTVVGSQIGLSVVEVAEPDFPIAQPERIGSLSATTGLPSLLASGSVVQLPPNSIIGTLDATLAAPGISAAGVVTGEAQLPTVVIGYYGDSTIIGVNGDETGPDYVEFPAPTRVAQITGATVNNYGLAGATLTQWLNSDVNFGIPRTWEAEMAQSQDSLIIFCSAINDWELNEVGYKAAWDRVLAACIANGKTFVIQTSNPTAQELWGGSEWSDYEVMLKAGWAKDWALLNNVVCIDVFMHVADYLNANDQIPAQFTPDGGHPTQPGYDIIGAYAASRLLEEGLVVNNEPTLPEIVGNLTVTLAGLGLSSGARAAVAGAAGLALQAATLTGAGAVALAGGAVLGLAAPSLLAGAGATVVGAASNGMSAPGLLANGAVTPWQQRQGELTATMPDASLQAAGSVTPWDERQGELVAALPDASVQVIGSVQGFDEATGALNITLQAPGFEAEASVVSAGTATVAANLPALAAAAGAQAAGGASVVLPGLALLAAGGGAVGAAFTSSLSPLALAGEGANIAEGQLIESLPDAKASGTATSIVSAQFEVEMGAIEISATNSSSSQARFIFEMQELGAEVVADSSVVGDGQVETESALLESGAKVEVTGSGSSSLGTPQVVASGIATAGLELRSTLELPTALIEAVAQVGGSFASTLGEVGLVANSSSGPSPSVGILEAALGMPVVEVAGLTTTGASLVCLLGRVQVTSNATCSVEGFLGTELGLPSISAEMWVFGSTPSLDRTVFAEAAERVVLLEEAERVVVFEGAERVVVFEGAERIADF